MKNTVTPTRSRETVRDSADRRCLRIRLIRRIDQYIHAADRVNDMDTSDVEATEAEDGAGSRAHTDETAGRTFDLSEAAVSAIASSTPTVADATLNGGARGADSETLSSVLVAVGGGPHSGATVGFARGLAEAADAWLELFHVVPPAEGGGSAREDDTSRGTVAGDAAGSTAGDVAGSSAGDVAGSTADGDDTRPIDERGERLLSAAADRLGGFDRVDRWMIEGESPADAIVEQSAYYDAVVVGASTTGAVGRFVFDCTTDVVVDESAVPVIVVEADGSTELIDG